MSDFFNTSIIQPKGDDPLMRRQTGEINPVTSLDQSDGFNTSSIKPRPSTMHAGLEYRFPVDEYEKYIGKGQVHPEFGEFYLQRRRAEAQSGWEQFAGFLNQGLIGEVVGGTIEGVGYLLDWQGMGNMLRGTEQEFGNWFSDIGKSIRTWTEEKTPVYRDPLSKTFDPTDWSWWMQNGKSVFSTLSLIIPSGFAAKGVMKGAQALGALNKIAPMSKWAMQGVSQAVISRHMESLMEASGIHEEVFEEALTKGMSYYDAKKKAAIAAQSVYNRNWAMLLQDIPQYMLLNRGFSKALLGGAEKSIGATMAMGKSLLPVVGSKTAAIGWDMLSEGFEEGYQFVVGEEAKHIANKVYGDEDGTPFSDRMKKYVQDGEFWTSVWFGALGAGLFQTAGKKVNQWIKGEKDYQLEDIKSWGAQISHGADKIREADVLGRESGKEAARNNALSILLARAGISNNFDNLRDFGERLQNPTQEDLELFGVSKEDIEVLGVNKEDFLEDINHFEKLWTNNANKYEHVLDRITRAEWLLDKYNKYQNELLERKERIKSEIANIEKMSYDGQRLLELNERIRHGEKAIEFQNQRIKRLNLTGAEKVGAEKAIEVTQKHIDITKDQIKDIEDNRDPLEKKADEELNLSSASLFEFSDVLSGIPYVEQAINSMQNQITKLQQEERELRKGRKPKKEPDTVEGEPDTKDVTDTKDEDLTDDDSDFIIEPGDLVEYLDTNGNKLFDAVVEFEDDAGDYTISRLDEKGNRTDDVIVTSDVNLNLTTKYEQREHREVEPISEEDITDKEALRNFDRVTEKNNSGLADVIRSLAYIARGIKNTFDVLNEKLNDYITNPKNTLKDAIAIYEIDTTSDKAKSFWLKSDIPEGLKQKIKAKKPLLPDEVESILAITQTRKNSQDIEEALFVNAVDRMPIKIKVVDGENTFTGGMFVHESSYDNVFVPKAIRDQGKAAVGKYIHAQQLETRKVRRTILEGLLAGNKVYTKNLSKTAGHYNNVKDRTNIIETLGGNLKDSKLYIVRSNEYAYGAIDEIMSAVEGTPGSIITMTTKTATGEKVPVRVLPTKLTKEHAEILYDAIEIAFTSGKGGFRAAFKDDRVKGLNVGEVIRYLALFGDKSTNINNPKNKLESYLASKQLFVHENQYLYYGEKGKISLWESDPKRKEINKKAFVEWATKNKNYNIMLNHKELGISLNKELRKSFKIGKWEYDASEKLTYAQVLMSKAVDGKGTWAVMTDLAEWKDTGSVMTRPVFILGQSAEDLVIEEKNKPKVPKGKTSKQTEAAEQKKDKKLKNAADVIDLPAGTTIYTMYDIPDQEGRSIGQSRGVHFEVILNDKGDRVFRTVGLRGTNYNQRIKDKDNINLDDKSISRVDLLDKLGKLIDAFKRGYPSIAEEMIIDTGNEPVVQTPSETVVEAPKKPVETRSGKSEPEVSEKTKVPEKGSIEAKKADIERRRQDKKARYLNDRFSRVEDHKKYLAPNQEAPLEIGSAYYEGMKITASFTLDERTNEEEEGYQIIIKVNKPQINTDGVMTQSGVVEVGIFDSKEAADEWVEETRIKVQETRKKKEQEIDAEYDAELVALEQKSLDKSEPDKSEPNTGDTLDNIDDILGLFEYKGDRAYVKIDVDKELKWLRKRFKNLPVNLVNNMIPLGGNRVAFGRLLSDMMLLYTGAEEGAVYHEALHRVTLGLLSPDDRQSIWAAARKEYNMPDATDREIDEKLAEEFRAYKLSGVQPKNRSIREFFIDLWNLIKSMFTGRTALTSFDIQRFFEDIERGKFKYVKPTKENIALLDKWRPAMEIPLFDTTADFNAFITKLASLLLEVNDIDDLNKVSNIKYSNLLRKINNTDTTQGDYGITQRLASVIANTKALIEEGKIPQEKIAETNRKLEAITNVYNLYKAVDSAEYRDLFEDAVSDALVKFNIRRKRSDDYDDTKDMQIDSGIEKYDKSSYEINDKDNILASIKFLIATLPNSPKVNEYTGTPDYVDFNSIWSSLKNDLHHAENIDEMILLLKDKSEKYPYKVLLDKLNNDEKGYLKQQFRVAMSGHKHDFLNILFKQIYNRKDGETTFTFSLSQADVQRYSKLLRFKWNLNFYNSEYVVIKPDKTVTTDNELINKVVEDYNNFVAGVRYDHSRLGYIENFDDAVTELVSLLNRIQISVDNDTIYEYLSTLSGNTEADRLMFAVADRIKYLFNKITPMQDGDTIIPFEQSELRTMFEDEGIARELADAYSRVHPEEMSDSILGPDGNIYYIHSKNSYITDKVRKFRKDDQYLKDLAATVGTKNSYFIKQMLEDDNLRQSLLIHTFSGFHQERSGDKGRDYLKLNPIEDYLFKMFALESGVIPFPTMADKRTYYLLRGMNLFSKNNDIYTYEGEQYTLKDEVIDVFYGYLMDEVERIETAKDLRRQYNEAKKKYEEDPSKENKEQFDHLDAQLIENYHYFARGGIKSLSDGNAYKFHYFPSFNEKMKGNVLFDLRIQGKEAIRQILLDNINAEIEYAINLGLIARGSRGNLYNLKLDKNLLSNETLTTQNQDLAIYNLIARMFINSTMSNIESDKLFSGDPAFYKKDNTGNVHTDNVKRLGVFSSTGDIFATTVSEQGIDREEYNVLTLSTQKYSSVYHEEMLDWHTSTYKDLLTKFYQEKGVERTEEDIQKEAKIIAQEKLSGYLSLDPTDGQAWISPDMYRELSIRLGEWSDEKQKAFEILQSDQEIGLETLDVVFQPLKLVYFDLSIDNGLATPIYDKMSVGTVFRQMANGNQIEDMLDRMELKGKYAGKNLTPIDMVKVDSAVKVGNRQKADYYNSTLTEVNDLSNVPTFAQKFSSLRRQLVTDPHYVERTKTGTQFIKLVLSNIDLVNAIYKMEGRQESLTGQELANIAFDSLNSLSNKGRQYIEEKFGMENGRIDTESFVETLRRSAILSDSTRNLINAIKMDADGKNMYLEVDSYSDKNWIQSMIISMINKETIDLKLPGNQFIQFSNFGIRKVHRTEETTEDVAKDYSKRSNFITWLKKDTNDLKFIRKDESGNIQSMEAIVSINLFRYVIPNFTELTYKQKLQYLKDNPEILAYRIPTQGQSSIMTLKVVGVYPETIGDTITLPSEFTTLTGSDFDIDKLFVVRYNYDTTGRKLKKIKFIDGDTTDRKTLEKIYRNRYGKVINLWEYLNRKINLDPNLVYEKLTEEQANILHRMYNSLEDDVVSIDMLEVLTKGKFTTKKYEELTEYVNSLPSLEQFIEDSLGKNIYELNSRKAVENRLLDVYFSIMKNPAHYADISSPLGFLRKKLERLSDTVRKAEARVEGRLDLMEKSPRHQQLLKWYYTSGKNGIGPFALNNVHHILSQVAGLKMKFNTNGILNEDADGNLDLSRVYDKNELIQIQAWLSAMIDAFVDLAKDPYIIDLNVNDYTFNVAALLLRGGLGEQTFEFLSQPILKELAEAEVLGNSTKYKITKDYWIDYGDDNEIKVKALTYIKDKWTRLLKEGDKFETTTDMSKIFNDKLLKDIKNPDRENQEFIKRQLNVLSVFEELKKQGAYLNTLIQASQIDTKKHGNNIIANKLFLENIRAAYLLERFINIEKVLPFDPITMEPIQMEGANFLGTYIDNSILFSSQVFENITIHSTPVFEEVFDKIYRIIDPPMLNKDKNERIARVISDEIFASIVSEFFATEIGVKPESLKTLFDKTVSTLINIESNKDGKYDYLQDNPLIKYLNLVPTEDNSLPPFLQLMIAVPNRSLKDNRDRDPLSDGYRDLMKAKDKEVRDLGRFLWLYSFYTSGFRNRLYSFFNIIPNEVQKEMKILNPARRQPGLTQEQIDEMPREVAVSYNNYIRQLRINMSDPANLPAYDRVISEFFENNWSDDFIVPEIPSNLVDTAIDVIGNTEYDTSVILVFKENNQLLVGTNSHGKPLFKPYVKDSNGETTYLYKFVGAFTIGSGEGTVYQPVYKLIPKRSYDKRGFVVKEYGMESSIIPSNNVKTITTKQLADYLKSNKFKEQNPTLTTFEQYDISGEAVALFKDQLLDEDTPDNTNKEELKANALLDRLLRAQNEIMDMADLTLHSGGAYGADSFWGDIGEEFGVVNINHYYLGTKTPKGNVEISDTDRNEGRYKAARAAKATYGYQYKVFNNELIIRNWAQVKHADAVFAIGTIAEVGERLFPNQPNDTRLAAKQAVTGGTGYAVEMAIQAKKPVFIYDQDRGYWYTWDGTKFVETETPVLTKNFAGIGTRDINKAGIEAIRDVYAKTLLFVSGELGELQSPYPTVTITEVSDDIKNIYSKLGDKTVSENVRIEPWSSLKNTTSPYNKVDGTIVHIISTRIKNSDKHFGNPFTHDARGKVQGLVEVDSIKEAVENYIEWIVNGIGNFGFEGNKRLSVKEFEILEAIEDRRQWILEQLQSGNLKGKPILYYTELNEPSHATALDYLINKHNWVETKLTTPITLSTKENPLKIYTDGSDIKGTGQIGSGVWFEYNGKEYSKSTISNVESFKTQYNVDDNVSNPTMEIVALVDALEEFAHTSEHLEIFSDYEGVQKWVNGSWKAKKPYIQGFVNRAKELIKQIESNGGSVKLTHVRGHSGIKGNEKVDAVAKDRNVYNTISGLVSSVVANKKTISKEGTQLELFERAKIEAENDMQTILSKVNAKFDATYTIEDLNNMSDRELNNILECL